ncbi:uncharacterized protein LOC126366921 [Pectinophora gossypiella]|uniref:uncharacterized protein LOC126366921 n=1 Tax=Pectinophora gossypiella TaxID=13191 RepID=UPI00214E192A|nr:uncharacterized protein LOC126366921 [Pectinophora gossypiella]
MWNATKGIMKSYGDHPGTPRPGCSNAAMPEPTFRREIQIEPNRLNKSNIPRRTWSPKGKEKEKPNNIASADHVGRGPKCQRVQMVNVRPDWFVQSVNDYINVPPNSFMSTYRVEERRHGTEDADTARDVVDTGWWK